MNNLPLVLQLQELATNNESDISELLRKSLLVSTKLDLTEFRDWANSELHGYKEDSNVPAYRQVLTDLRVLNPYHGYIPFLIDDPEFMDLICNNVKVTVGIGSLIDLLHGPNPENARLVMPLPSEVTIDLMRMQGRDFQLEPQRIVGRNQIAGILDEVRTIILEWSLKLEKDNILGEGLTFSAAEKNRAHANINIQNFQGILGDVSQSKVTQNLHQTVKQGDFESLRTYLEENGIGAQDLDDLKSAISSDPPGGQVSSYGENVGHWVGNMISKAATGAWDIGIGAAGGLLGNAIGAYYGLN
ncbi:AbiTii domain-containing protein [Gimesia maris]|uniref:AbiTii domain-containing protein n=1 Tax=Gimesia maris TaxID=122 RepID=A0ABX5YIK4_9PLAN|nr:hypothetical protein [Gimesia maris]EDL58260.1 hypothetical protein PM8797T_17032 [Gimesia maris DSM 8797]QEG15534.1 hypothetical protein GmarT_13750 [Gimesia maris]QGQ31168.1 hypothetical protein F1729_22420 [Gimesia maris]